MIRLGLLACVLGAGCQGGDTVPLFEKAPDFSLVDTNTTSQTFDNAVSPRDARGRISAWYFGHSS